MKVKELKSGIYKIVNKLNGKIYIGSAVNLIKRKNQHLHYLRKGTHPNIHLQRSYNKHGEESFIFIIIERCKIQELISKEQFYMNNLKPQYNICPVAGSSLGRVTTEETKMKMKISHSKRNCKHKYTTRLKMSIIAKESNRKPNEEAIKKSANSRKKPIIQLTKEGKFIQEYNCIQDAVLKYNSTNISEVLKGKRKTACGYIWRYKNEISC